MLDTTIEWKCHASTLHVLGRIAMHRKPPLLGKALYHFQQVLELKLQYLTDDDFSLSSDYNWLGFIYMLQNKFDLALENFQRALTIELSVLLPLTSDQTKIATYYNNIGYVLMTQEKPAGALAFCHCALDIQNTIIESPAGNLTLANIHNMTAICLSMLGRYTEAIEHSQTAVGRVSYIWPSGSGIRKIYKSNHNMRQIGKKSEQCSFS